MESESGGGALRAGTTPRQDVTEPHHDAAATFEGEQGYTPSVPAPPQWQVLALNAARGTAHKASHQLRRPFRRQRPVAVADHAARRFDPQYLVGDLSGSGVPTLLLPGLTTKPGTLAAFGERLSANGVHRTLRLRQPGVIADPKEYAYALRNTVATVLAQTTSSSVAIIAHGTAGLAARYYAQFLQDGSELATVMTLGTPHLGTMITKTSVFKVAMHLRPTSDFMQALAAPLTTPCATAFVSYWSDLDSTVLPAVNADLVHPDLNVISVGVRGLGHTALLDHPRILHDITYRLQAAERATL